MFRKLNNFLHISTMLLAIQPQSFFINICWHPSLFLCVSSNNMITFFIHFLVPFLLYISYYKMEEYKIKVFDFMLTYEIHLQSCFELHLTMLPSHHLLLFTEKAWTSPALPLNCPFAYGVWMSPNPSFKSYPRDEKVDISLKDLSLLS
jgi:hypothetical protein